MVTEIYVAADIEADGPIPGPYSMLSLGLSVVGRPEQTFYTELKPISDQFVQAAMDVNGLDRDRLIAKAPEPEAAMAAARDFIQGLEAEEKERSGQRGRAVFLAGPAVWDGMFIHWYFINFLGKNPFGVTGSGIDFRSYWMGLTHTRWNKTGKKAVAAVVGPVDLPHTHRADDDAMELAQYFEKVLAHQESRAQAQAASKEALEASQAEQGHLRRRIERLESHVVARVAVVVKRGEQIAIRTDDGRARLPGGALRQGRGMRSEAARKLGTQLGLSVEADALSFVRAQDVMHDDARDLVVFFEIEAPVPELSDPWRFVDKDALASLEHESALAAWLAGGDA